MGGLQSKIEFGALDTFCSVFDIICITETKSNYYDFDDTLLEEYEIIRSPHEYENESLFAAHGICILAKKEIKLNMNIVTDSQSKFVLWVKIDSAVTGFDFILGVVYLPCESSVHYDQEMYDDISCDISNFEYPVCLIGDFNARTSNNTDIFDSEDRIAQLYGLCDIENSSELIKTLLESKNFQRSNMDRIINSAGYNLLDLCKINDLCILNGRFGQDRNVGAFTCYTHNGASCIDYVLMSSSLLNHINNFAVHDYDSLLSDTHCAISLSLTSLANVNDSHTLEKTPDPNSEHGAI